jgi:hypothetical protein
MGREVRMVPANWEHPKYDAKHPKVGQYIPKLDSSYEDDYRNWEEEDLPKWKIGKVLWDEGFIMTYADYYSNGKSKVAISDYLEKRRKEERNSWNPTPENPDYTWWAGEEPDAPDPEYYMPQWPEEERTHYMMYEDTSEGTPISPAFATPEELAKWLADTGASSFADFTATYDQWLSTIKRGSAVSAVIDNNGMRSGVEALHKYN